MTGLLTSLRSLDPEPTPDPVSVDAPVLRNEWRTDRYWRMALEAPRIAATVRPGQFVMITAARRGEVNPLLPRPMAVYDCDADAGTVEFLYGVVGAGTQHMTSFAAGEAMTVVGPLGRPFQVAPGTSRILLLGRGIGTCSLTLLGRRHVGRTEVTAVVSARSGTAQVGADLYRESGVTTIEVTDEAGTSSVDDVRRRLLTELDQRPPEMIASCGSDRLALLAGELGRRWDADVQVSVEAHMACGLGYCHGCATRISPVAESPLVCRDGSVFRYRPDSGERAAC